MQLNTSSGFQCISLTRIAFACWPDLASLGAALDGNVHDFSRFPAVNPANFPALLACGLGGRLRYSLIIPLVAAAAMAQVRPDFSAAVAFGLSLQRDYGAEKSRAITAKFDHDAMMHRVMGRGIRDRPEYSRLVSGWTEQAVPMLDRVFQPHDSFETLVVARVGLIEGWRALECVLLHKGGAFHLVTLLLVEKSPGAIGIADLRFASSTLEMTKGIRFEMLLRGEPLPDVLEEEEVRLAGFARAWRGQIMPALAAIARGEKDPAFRLWDRLPEEMKGTRVWIDHRNRLAFGGSAAAMMQLQAEARVGKGGPPAVRLSLAVSAKDRERALAALDDFIAGQRNLPFLRTVKADLLLTAGRFDEALTLARDIGALAPGSVAAHVVAFRASAALARPAVATEALADWARAMTPALVAKTVDGDSTAEVAAFRATPEYAEWRRANEAAPLRAPAN